MALIVPVVWMSRHVMSDVQEKDLLNVIDESLAAFGGAESMVVEHINMLFPARSEDAVLELAELQQKYMSVDRQTVFAGVLPAHIAAAIACDRQRAIGLLARGVYVPVAMPAPAVEGETRNGGFVHSHWECC